MVLVVVAGLLLATLLAWFLSPRFSEIEAFAVTSQSGSKQTLVVARPPGGAAQVLYLPFHGGTIAAEVDGAASQALETGQPGSVDRYRSSTLVVLPGTTAAPAYLEITALDDRLPAGLGTIYVGPRPVLEHFQNRFRRAVEQVNQVMPATVVLCLGLSLLMVFLSGTPARYGCMAGLFACSALIEFDRFLQVDGHALRDAESYVGIAYCTFFLLAISEWWERPKRDRHIILAAMAAVLTLVAGGDWWFGMHAAQTSILRQVAFIAPLAGGIGYWISLARRNRDHVALAARIALACAALGYLAAMLNLARLYTALPPGWRSLALFETKILGAIALLTWAGVTLTHEYRSYQRRRANGALLDRIVSGSNLAVDQQALALKAQIESRAVGEERTRMTRDLHDGLSGQLLSLLLKARSGELTPDMAERDVERCLADLRLIAAALDSGSDHLGTALETFRMRAAQQAEVSAVKLDWHQASALAALELGPRCQLDLLRALQEATTNALRHSRASRIEIRLTLGGDVLQVSVADDGVGLAPAGETPGPGGGMRNIRHRLQTHGGTSAWLPGLAGRGVAVCLTLPIR